MSISPHIRPLKLDRLEAAVLVGAETASASVRVELLGMDGHITPIRVLLALVAGTSQPAFVSEHLMDLPVVGNILVAEGIAAVVTFAQAGRLGSS